MIGTTEFEYCKEKAMGIIADLGISNNYWRNYWGNIGIYLLINNGWKH